MIGYIRTIRAFGPVVGLYFVATALVGFAFDGGVYAVLLNLFLVRLGYGPELIGLINSAGTLTFALSSLPAGALGERFGSRRIMMLGIGIMLGGGVLQPLADTIPQDWRLPWLLVNGVALYFGLALFFVNTAPFVMQIVGAAQRNRVFSLQTALISLAAFGGSLAGGLLPPTAAAVLGTTLSSPAPYRYALLVAGLALIPALFAIRAARPPALPAPVVTDRPAAPAGAATVAVSITGLLIIMALVRLLQIAGLAATNTFYNVYLDSVLLLPTAQIGAIVAAGRLLGVPAALATSALAARFGNRGVVIGTSLATSLAILPIAFIPHWSAAAFTFVGVTGLSWIRYAASIVYFLEIVPPARRATVSGVTEMAAGLCFTAVAFGGGYMIAALGYQALFLTGAALTAISALAFWLAFRRHEPRPEPAIATT